ncbi:MAG: RQC domain-containing protein, partial [Candidatus Thiodiazotropha endolucinida]
GQAANAWMIYGLQDVITLRQMQASSDADESHKRVERHKLDAMLAFCEITTCRRQTLLAYFDDHLEHPCGNCDTCLQPPETWDATVASQMALSCVHRTGQRFGVNHLIDVLLGKESDRISQFGHHRVSTFGIGKDLTATEWRTVYRQLIARGLLAVDLEGYGGLRLTQASRPVLRGETRLMLRKARKMGAKQQRKQPRIAEISDGNQAIWQALRNLRLELAQTQGVPAYVIFHDATLIEMAEKRPRDKQQLALISGVGDHKLERYGDAFLSLLKDDLEGAQNHSTDTVDLPTNPA